MSKHDKKIAVVTGGAGFIGSHLCERLVAEGYRVISLDNYFTGSRDNHVAGVEYREGHTKDIAKLIPEDPDIIYHLGEYSRVLTSFVDVATVWNLNVAGTFGVLEFCKHKKARLVYAGSSTKFGEFDDVEDGENQSPYAYFKASNTRLVNNYGLWFGLDYAITYFYNVYGPRERSGTYGTLIQIFYKKFKNNEPLTVVSPGTQQRNFTYVKDTVDGIILVGEKGSGDGYCIASPESYSVLEVAEMFGGRLKMTPAKPGDRKHSKQNVTKITELGWSPKQSLENYIRALKEDIS